ncbi:MAG: ABC transporter permease, partial [Actinomycetota bacterium]
CRPLQGSPAKRGEQHAETASSAVASDPASGGVGGTTGLGPQVVAFAGRAIRRFLRSSETVVNTAIFPLLLLLTLLAAFSEAVEAFEGGDYVQRLVPTLVVSGVMFGSIGAAYGLLGDLQSGFMDRIRSLPVAPLSLLLGTAIAELARALAAIAVLVGAGFVFGFRFLDGPAGAVGFVVAGAMLGPVLVWIGLAMATMTSSLETLGPPLGAIFLLLLFFSQGMVPLEAYPGWAQPVVRASPITAYVELLDVLARGGSVNGPVLRAIAWSVVLVLGFGGLATFRLSRTADRT